MVLEQLLRKEAVKYEKKGGEQDMEHKNSKAEYVRGHNGRNVAVISNKRLIKTAYGPQHMLQSPPSWAFDAIGYESNRSKFDVVIVIYWHCGLIYTVSADEFDANRREIDWGYGRQYYLPLKYWRTSAIFDDSDDSSEALVIESGD